MVRTQGPRDQTHGGAKDADARRAARIAAAGLPVIMRNPKSSDKDHGSRGIVRDVPQRLGRRGNLRRKARGARPGPQDLKVNRQTMEGGRLDANGEVRSAAVRTSPGSAGLGG